MESFVKVAEELTTETLARIVVELTDPSGFCHNLDSSEVVRDCAQVAIAREGMAGWEAAVNDQTR